MNGLYLTGSPSDAKSMVTDMFTAAHLSLAMVILLNIAVKFDIASTRNANGVYVNRVHLSMQHVIQLVTVDNVRTVSTTMAR